MTLPAEDPNCFPSASEGLPRLAVLGPAKISVGGGPLQLPRRWLEVLLRLAVDPGEAVAVNEIFRDVWRRAGSAVARGERTSVQKAISGLRHALGSSVIRTEDADRASAYRLVLGRDQIDADCFVRLVERASPADSITAVDVLTRALSLWRGRPFVEVESLPFARARIDQLMKLREDATQDLLDAYSDLGRVSEALDTARGLARLRPDDDDLRHLIEKLESDSRRSRRGVVRRTWNEGPAVSVVIVSGDLFAELDACLVIGFTDTFDTDTADDLIINSASVQAQAMRFIFEDDRQLLDRKLRTALRNHRPLAHEKRTAKRGKLARYAIGTVAVIRQADRWIFALAYGRMGNDLVTRSTPDDLRLALDELWNTVYLNGQLQPVAIPLIGTGLARVEGQGAADLLELIAGSFVERSRRGRISRELRIVVPPDVLADIDLAKVAESIDRL